MREFYKRERLTRNVAAISRRSPTRQPPRPTTITRSWFSTFVPTIIICRGEMYFFAGKLVKILQASSLALNSQSEWKSQGCQERLAPTTSSLSLFLQPSSGSNSFLESNLFRARHERPWLPFAKLIECLSHIIKNALSLSGLYIKTLINTSLAQQSLAVITLARDISPTSWFKFSRFWSSQRHWRYSGFQWNQQCRPNRN